LEQCWQAARPDFFDLKTVRRFGRLGTTSRHDKGEMQSAKLDKGDTQLVHFMFHLLCHLELQAYKKLSCGRETGGQHWMKTKNWVLLSPDPLHFMDLEISHVQTKFQRPHRVVEVEFSATLIPAPLTLPALQRKYYSSYQTGSNYISGCGTGRLLEKFHRLFSRFRRWHQNLSSATYHTGITDMMTAKLELILSHVSR